MPNPKTTKRLAYYSGLLLLSQWIAASPDIEDGDINNSDVTFVDISADGSSSSTENEAITEKSPLHVPPTHFHITSHIQTNLATGISYFLPQEALAKSYANIPFLECGAIGSTTEGIPLVSGVFRHVPNCGVVDSKRDFSIILEEENEEDASNDNVVEIELDGERFQDSKEHEQSTEHHPKRPTPPRYVVALSPFEVTVGGNGNQTQVFKPGDVIFMEDSWWGENDGSEAVRNETKGYVMRAHSDSNQDLNIMMLTVPPAVHRHWKNTNNLILNAEKDKNDASESKSARTASTSTRQPWWKLNLRKQNLPKPCSLESDPAFANPTAASTSLTQHFTQHFVKLLQGFSHPQGQSGFLPHQDLLLPILAQGAAGVVGAATAFGLVLQLLKIVPVQASIGFGGLACIVLGTYAFVALSEEILDELENWSGRKKLERRWKKSDHEYSNLDDEEVHA